MSEKEVEVPGTMPLEEQAMAWVVRLSSDQRTRQDDAQFDAWLAADERNGVHYAEGLQLWEAMGALRRDAQAHQILGSLLPGSFEQDNVERPAGLSRRAAIGGGLGLLAATLAGVLVLPNIITGGSSVFETAKGEQRRFTLDDGSTVTLDTATKLRVAFTDDQRLLTLERGQAFFDVAHDPSRPFRVFAGNDEIRALGTAFEVRFEQGQTRVILEEGKVAVFRGGAVKQAVLERRPNPLEAERATVVLAPGQEAKLTAVAATPEVRLVNLARTNAWRDGEMVFDDVSLATAVSEVNRYGGRQIVLGDASLQQLRVSGTFHTNSPEKFVEGVTAALPVRLGGASTDQLILKKI